MVTVARALKDAPGMAQRRHEAVYVVSDTLQDDTAFVMNQRPANGGRYALVARFDQNGLHYDRDGVLVGVPMPNLGPVTEVVQGAATVKAAVAQAAQDGAAERAMHELEAIRGELEALVALVRELEARGTGGVEVSGVLEQLGAACDEISALGLEDD